MVQQGVTTGNLAEVTGKKAALVSLQQRGNAFSVSSVTGVINAALAGNSAIFAMRLDPGAGGSKKAYIERVRITFTTIAAFTTPITAGRRLAIYRGGSGVTTGGAAIATVAKKHSTSVESEFETVQGGSISIATTGALTTSAITFESNEFATMSLVHLGNAGNFMESIFEFNTNESSPIVLEPGQTLAIRNPVAMDAGGTWQASVRVDWYEEDSVTL
jgi:hypothetical protein